MNRHPDAPEALLTEEEFAARLTSDDPRMAALSISNEVLRNSMPIAPPWSLSKWIDRHTGGSLRKLEDQRLAALDWLVARAPWQRWGLSVGLGAVIGLGIVFSGARFLRGGVQSAVASAEVGTVLPTAEVVAAVRPGFDRAPPEAAPVEAAAAPMEAPVAAALAAAVPVAVAVPAALGEAVPGDAAEEAAPDKAEKARSKKKSKRSRARHHKAQQDESNPLKQAAAQAAARLAQPRAKRSRTRAVKSF